MNRSFIEVPLFTKRWRELNLKDSELQELQIILLNNPKIGPQMEGTGGIRKMRFKTSNRGKSSGIRVCYVDFEEYGLIYLITAFQKKAQDNLTNDEKNILKKLVKELKDEASMRRSNNE